MSRRVLVTGAAGAVGSRVAALVRDRGWTVRALAHRRDPGGVDEVVRGDLLDRAALAQAVEGVDAVLHLAAVTHARCARDYERVNVEGTARLLEAAEQAGVGRFVHVSTRAIDKRGGAYCRSKLRAEALVERSLLERTIVRLPEVYGAGGSEGVDDIVRRAREGRRIPVVGRGRDTVCPIHVDDAVEALASALESDAARGGTYTLAGDCLSVAGFARACADRFGTSARLLHVPTVAVAVLGAAARFLPLPVYPDQLARLRAPKPSASPEAAADLGFRPRSLAEGLSGSGPTAARGRP